MLSFLKTVLGVTIPEAVTGTISKITKTNPQRERLKPLYTIATDKATYIGYNTQTVPDDAVNIEIEETRNGVKRIILEAEIFDDSWGGLCGDSFYSLVIDSRGHLFSLIEKNGETIIDDTGL